MQIIASLAAVALTVQASMAAPLEARNNNGGGKINYVDDPHSYTSAFHTRAVNTTIINNDGNPVNGLPGAFGQYALRVNSNKNIICWDITTVGVTGEYMSPAITATHMHEAAVGKPGPPRVAFPNPKFVSTNAMGQEVRRSSGCQKAPFFTGVNTATGVDSGSASGFVLKNVEANPSGFMGDTHTVEFPAGAIRGQLNPSELEVGKPSYFTSTLLTQADGNQIISTVTQQPVAGAPNGKGYYELKLNTDKDILCYDIVLSGSDISTDYASPAKTATHTHQGVFAANGPPRLAYKNPTQSHSKIRKFVYKLSGGKFGKSVRKSSACIKGPFTTGLNDAMTGKDTGSASGFTLKALQDNPTGFFSDVHTAQFAQGAVRGQMFQG